MDSGSEQAPHGRGVIGRGSIAASSLPEGIALDALRHAVGSSTSWRGVLRRLGLTSTSTGRRRRRVCDDVGIEYGHFRSNQHAAPDRAALTSAVQESAGWREVMAKLGYAADSGSARALLRRRAEAVGLATDHLDRPALPAERGPFSVPSDDKHLRRAAPLLVAAACALRGFDVSWPLEPRSYDLVVDAGAGGLLRVQVKSGTHRTAAGGWAVWITRRNAAGQRTPYSLADVDHLGIVDGDHRVYMIPLRVVEGQTCLYLAAYERYVLT